MSHVAWERPDGFLSTVDVPLAIVDGLDWLVSRFGGGESEPAQTRPVQPTRLPPKLSQVAARGQAPLNTVTINVSLQPDESGEALAQRIAQAQARALAVRNRGGLYDPAVVY